MLIEKINKDGERPGARWRVVFWSLAALCLVLPLIAMQFTDEVNWSPGDFVVAGVLLAGVGMTYELVVRKAGNAAYRAGAGLALVATLLMLWVNGAVGIIGAENNDVNMLYFGVLALGVAGAILTRFRANSMSYIMLAIAISITLIAVITLIAGWHAPDNGLLEIVTLNGFFIALFAGSATLFRQAGAQAVGSGCDIRMRRKNAFLEHIRAN